MDGSYYGAWLTPVRELLDELDITSETVVASECTGPGVTALVADGRADLAVYPVLYNYPYPGHDTLRFTFPLDSTGPVFVSKRTTPHVSPLTTPFTRNAWLMLLAAGGMFVAATAFLGGRGRRLMHVPGVLLAATCGTVIDLDAATPLAVRVVYAWLSILSLILLSLYTAVLSSLLVLDTVRTDSLRTVLQGNATISVTPDVQEQLTLGAPPLALTLNTVYELVQPGDAVRHLPAVVAWPASAMIKRASCDDLDFAYHELTKHSQALVARKGALPSAFFDALADMTRSNVFGRSVQAFNQSAYGDAPFFCPNKSLVFTPDAGTVQPVAYIAAVWMALSWTIYFAEGWYTRTLVPIRTRALKIMLSGRRRHRSAAGSGVPAAEVITVRESFTGQGTVERESLEGGGE